MVYVSLLTEYEKYAKLLTTMTKGDVLLLLYPEGKDQITVPIMLAINASKGKVIYDEVKALKALNEEIAVAYRLGGLQAKYGELKAMSDSPLITGLLSPGSSKTGSVPKERTRRVDSVNSTEKPVRTPRRKTVKTAPAEPDMKNDDVQSNNIVSKVTLSEETKATSLKRRSKKKVVPEEGTFEYEMYRFESLCESVKTKDFNPKDYMSSISKAVQDAIRDQEALKDKVSLYFSPNISKLVLKAFKDKEKELFDIVQTMHSLDK